MSFLQSSMHNRRRRASFPRLCLPDRRLLVGWLVLAIMCGAPASANAQQARQPPAGATVETAIVLPQIADEFHGVSAEHAYIARHYPTWHIENQATFEHAGHRYDRLGMIEPDGTKTAIYFDITAWFGK
jgi:hypothetical protein